MISEKLGGVIYVINARGAVGDEMIPWNIWFLMCCFDVLEMSGLPGCLLGKENMKERLKPP